MTHWSSVYMYTPSWRRPLVGKTRSPGYRIQKRRSGEEAGIAGGKPVFLMPGSTKAVELALTRLILPEIPHLLTELTK